MALLASTLMYAQTEITGTVVDDLGEGVIGATVKEKGTSNGSVTDFDGNFKLKVKAGAMLVVTYIGYDPVEVAAAPGMKVTLKENASELAEVVVTGYQVQRKADLTGSVAVVKTDELKTSADTDPMRALQGKVAGMTITHDGSPVGAGTVRIRGIGSVAGPALHHRRRAHDHQPEHAEHERHRVDAGAEGRCLGLYLR